MSDAANSPSPESPAFGPTIIRVQATVEIPDNLLPLYAGIKNSYKANDSKVVTDCVRFALFCYQQGLVGKSDNLLDSLINQVAAFDTLRERIQQTHSAVRQAVFVSTAVVTTLQTELAQRPTPAAR